MALSFYTRFPEDLVDAGLDWVADSIKISIHTVTETFTAADAFWVNVSTTNEVTGTNYTSGGLALANKTASLASPCVMSADDVIINQSGGGFSTGRTYVIYKVVGSPATDPLIAHGTAGGTFGNLAGQLTLDVPVSWITVTA